jgi:hypothetical protein
MSVLQSAAYEPPRSPPLSVVKLGSVPKASFFCTILESKNSCGDFEVIFLNQEAFLA